MPSNVHVTEDFPEEWIDRRLVLKPVFNAARKSDKLKDKTFLSKDKLFIDGTAYTATNITEANKVIDVPGTCQRSDNDKTLFFGIHSVFSNLHPAQFRVENISYNCVEQMIQGQKAAYFNDDVTHAKIMRELNPYKMKKLGSKVKHFSDPKWKQVAKKVAYTAVKAKFQQNPILGDILQNTGNAKIAEGSTDDYWGTGIHLYAKNAMDPQYWSNEGGVMSEIYARVRDELRT